VLAGNIGQMYHRLPQKVGERPSGCSPENCFTLLQHTIIFVTYKTSIAIATISD
jgi:hypothetical protein